MLSRYLLLIAGALGALTALASTGTAQAAWSRGYDVSYPECGQALPSARVFAVVGVNGGVANSRNHCLHRELSWAHRSVGDGVQAKVQLYINTGDPGDLHGKAWPHSNLDPVSKSRTKDPFGACHGRNSTACAWQYGWNMAALDAKRRGVHNAGEYNWWLDVEISNYWESNKANNRAVLAGMTTYLQNLGATVGIYSTGYQWQVIAGAVTNQSRLYWLPEWITGASTAAQATKNCRQQPLTGGGWIVMSQWFTNSATIDRDVSCL